jgi:hypothetical protein
MLSEMLPIELDCALRPPTATVSAAKSDMEDSLIPLRNKKRLGIKASRVPMLKTPHLYRVYEFSYPVPDKKGRNCHALAKKKIHVTPQHVVIVSCRCRHCEEPFGTKPDAGGG